MKKFITITASILVLSSIIIAYFIGYYIGVSKSIFLTKLLNATTNIHAINNIKSNKPDKAINLLSGSLEDDISAIKDIDNNYNKPDRMLIRLYMYRELLDYDRKDLLEKITNKYNKHLQADQIHN